MCRVAVTVRLPKSIATKAANLLSNGSDGFQEIWGIDEIWLVHNRFDVTSTGLPQGTFPLEGERFVLSLNGEVYEFRGIRFVTDSRFASDIHFASYLIHKYGVEEFLAEVDFQGTLLIYDKLQDSVYVAVDQLNTAGCFYSELGDGRIIAASEYAVINEVLEDLSIPSTVPINIIPNGSYLRADQTGDCEIILFRDSSLKVWSGEDFSTEAFNECVSSIDRALTNAIESRIPRTGCVVALAGGGIDSSIVVVKITKYLREIGQVSRLRVVALGSSSDMVDEERNDFVNVERLVQHLGIEQEQLIQIHPNSIQRAREVLYQKYVFSRNPRLIPPDPSRTQIRHTVTMSSVLGMIVNQLPEVRCVLSGDGADELFGGYNSMLQRVDDGRELRERIVHKLRDFPLNDASRVSLASYFGTWEASGVIGGAGKSQHPMEVRMPFTCHHVLNAARIGNADHLVGQFKKDSHFKFILRAIALRDELPEHIAVRKKMPFHEGATGTRNGDTDRTEMELAKKFLSQGDALQFAKEHEVQLNQLGVCIKKPTKAKISANIDRLAMFSAAFDCGLDRLMLGNAFDNEMPDAIYSTDVTGEEYMPRRQIEIDKSGHAVLVVSSDASP